MTLAGIRAMLLGPHPEERGKGASYNLQLAPLATRMSRRSSLQTGVRIAALVFVLAWLFVDRLQAWVPFWLPFVVLLATEVEFVLGGRSEPRRTQSRRTPPGPEDADLGFGELVDDDEGVRWIPPPARPKPPRSRWVVRAVAALAVVVLFAFAARTDRAGTWQALPREERTAAVKRFTSEAAKIAGRPVTLRCDEQYDFTGAGSDTLGIAFPGAGIAYLDPSICRALHDLLANGKAGERQAEALVVLAHEAIHLGGERREGVTECLALQEAVPLGVRFGLSEPHARSLMHAQYEARLAERTVIRAAYALPRSCRDGGALDRTPGDGRFP
jgi:hypothetical protein